MPVLSDIQYCTVLNENSQNLKFLQQKNFFWRHDYLHSVSSALDREPRFIRKAAQAQYDLPRCEHGPTLDYTHAVSQMIGDYQFTCDSLWFAEEVGKLGANAYVYFFNYRISKNPWPKWTGVMHAYEVL